MSGEPDDVELDEDEGSPGYERAVAFSDGVFANAITLLVLAIEVPDVPEDQLGDALSDLFPQLISFFVGFGVIGLFWLGHHAFFGRLRRFDGTLLRLNLAFLAFISVMPFTQALFGRFNDVTEAIVLYAASVAIASGIDTLMLWLALRRDLLELRPGDDPQGMLIRNVLPAVVFLLSIPVAFAWPRGAPYVWLLLLVAPRAHRSAQARSRATLS
jgi:uncharacterized membrane protein